MHYTSKRTIICCALFKLVRGHFRSLDFCFEFWYRANHIVSRESFYVTALLKKVNLGTCGQTLVPIGRPHYPWSSRSVVFFVLTKKSRFALGLDNYKNKCDSTYFCCGAKRLSYWKERKLRLRNDGIRLNPDNIPCQNDQI